MRKLLHGKLILTILLLILVVGAVLFFWPWRVRGILLAKPYERLIDLVQTQYDDDTILEIASIANNVVNNEGIRTIEELNTLYPVEAIRRRNNIYTVLYKGVTRVATVSFSEDLNFCFGGNLGGQRSLSDYDAFTKGPVNIKDLILFDPAARVTTVDVLPGGWRYYCDTADGGCIYITIVCTWVPEKQAGETDIVSIDRNWI